ncbi:hypothetical protein QR680_011316 [Steinernema hermaphroditum]|uniref:Uncharacterized protein n=1 Tax=Steinernema hermaphroditum TaxID=289476 RepID=A0AA39MDA4_9BILA|nr:hypothetical protein QR680_011316 [Steinernema hermaphroditum]
MDPEPRSWSSDYGATPRAERSSTRHVRRRLFEDTPPRSSTPILDDPYVPPPNTPFDMSILSNTSCTPYLRPFLTAPNTAERNPQTPMILDISPTELSRSFRRDELRSCERRVPEPAYVDDAEEDIEKQMKKVWDRLVEKNSTSKAYVLCIEDLLAEHPQKEDVSAAKRLVHKNRALIAEIAELLRTYEALKTATELDTEL